MYRLPTEDTGNPETQAVTDQKNFSRKSLVLEQERATWQDRKLLEVNC